jgi:predicted transcriptional regulator of viral defense system
MHADHLPDSSRPSRFRPRLRSEARLGNLITTAELQAAGLTAARIRSLVRKRALVPVARGIYARPTFTATVLSGHPSGERILRVAAAVTLAGPATAGSHHDAAILHGLDLLDQPPANVVAVTRPLGTTGRRTGRYGVKMHTAALPADHVTQRQGVRVTSVARTVVDIARTTPLRSGVVTADSALRTKQTSRGELREIVQACSRWPGIQRARDVVEFSDGRSESVFESISRVAFREHRLPPPELQVWVGGDDQVAGRVDFLWRKYRTVAEADGAAKYSDPSRARMQLQRDARLRAGRIRGRALRMAGTPAHARPGDRLDQSRIRAQRRVLAGPAMYRQ